MCVFQRCVETTFFKKTLDGRVVSLSDYFLGGMVQRSADIVMCVRVYYVYIFGDQHAYMYIYTHMY